MSTINIRSVKLHTMERPHTTTDGGGGERAAASTTSTTEDTTITYPVSIPVFEAPASDYLNDEAFRGVVAQPMDKMPVRPLSILTDDGGLVVRDVLAHLMDESTVYMPSLPQLP